MNVITVVVCSYWNDLLLRYGIYGNTVNSASVIHTDTLV
jgi:hypothetical protein